MARVRVREIEAALGKGVRSGAERMFQCPAPGCGDSDKATLYVNVQKQTFFCQKCEIGRGNKLGGIWDALGLEKPDVGTGSSHPDDAEKPKARKRPKRVPHDHASCLHPLGSQPVSPAVDPLAAGAWDYLLHTRGLDPKVVRRAGVAVGTGQWSGYVLFPVWDGLRKDCLMFFSGRAYAPGVFPPQRHPPSEIFPLDAGEVVYGADRAQALGWSVLCEAPLDALKVNEFAMATYGKGVTDAQVDLICSLGLRKLVIYFDDEPDAQARAWDLALRISPNFRDGVWIAVPPNKDPGASTYDENRAAVAHATLVTPDGTASRSQARRLRWVKRPRE